MADWNHYWTPYTIEEVTDNLIELADRTRYYINRGSRGGYVKSENRQFFPMFDGVDLWDLPVEIICSWLNAYGARPTK